MNTYRLPLLSLHSGETHRLPALEIHRLLGCSCRARLPLQLSLDEAWLDENLSARFLVYYEVHIFPCETKDFANRFRLVEVVDVNREVILDEGRAGGMSPYLTRREDAHESFFGRGRKIGLFKFILPLSNTDWRDWPRVAVR